MLSKMIFGARNTFLLMLFIGCTGLKCYQCNSLDNKGCDDPFDPDEVVSNHCEFKDSICALIEVRLKKTGKLYKVRGCMSSTVTCTEIRKEAYAGDREVTECTFCYSDGCNDDTPHSVGEGTVSKSFRSLIILLVYIIVKKYL